MATETGVKTDTDKIKPEKLVGRKRHSCTVTHEAITEKDSYIDSNEAQRGREGGGWERAAGRREGDTARRRVRERQRYAHTRRHETLAASASNTHGLEIEADGQRQGQGQLQKKP